MKGILECVKANHGYLPGPTEGKFDLPPLVGRPFYFNYPRFPDPKSKEEFPFTLRTSKVDAICETYQDATSNWVIFRTLNSIYKLTITVQ